VNFTADSSNTCPPLSPAARVVWAALIFATLYLCYFYNLGAIGLVGPDEPRYAWIARDMAESGDWVTPRLYSKPWFEKPPLYYWGAALSFKMFGVSEVAARLPSAVCALLATLAMAWLAWRVYGAETARWLLLLLPTTVGMIGFSHAAATDMPFAAMLTVAMVFAAKLLNLIPPLASAQTSPHSLFSFISLTSSTSFSSFLFGAFLGFAALAKGPAAIILSGGAVLLWAAFVKRWHDAFRCLHPVAITGFCFTALPWYILCARRNSDFFRVFIIEHNFKRFLTPEFQHIQPFWFYLPVLLIAFLPWTSLLLFAGFFRTLEFWRERKISPSTVFFCCWLAFCILFFSFSRSKLPGYILPALPPIGILLARSLTLLMPLLARYFRWLLALYGVVLLTMAIPLFLFLGHTLTSRETPAAARALALILAFFAVANWVLLLYKTNFEPPFPLSAFCVLPILGVALIVPSLLPEVFPYDPSGKTLGAELASKQISSDLFVGPMGRGQYFSLNFYLHRELPNWDSDNPKEGYLLLSSRTCRLRVKAPWACGNNPLELPLSGWFVYSVAQNDLPGGLGGAASGGSAGSNRDNREPR